jgi:hypothetical protein
MGFVAPIKRHLIGCHMARDGHPNLYADSISFPNASGIPGFKLSATTERIASPI